MNKAKLKELINIETGSLNVQDSEKNGKYPFFSRKKEIYFLNEYTHDKEAIIVAGEGDFTPKYINGKFALHQRAYALSSTTELLSNKYLYYFIHTQKKILEKYSVGTTVQSLRKASFEELEISLPPLHEQQKIASVLSALDDQIELNNKINQELEDLAQTLYNYWFVQFEFPNEEGKPYKSSGGKMVWNEELKQEIPEGWEVKQLGELFLFEKGKTPNEVTLQYTKGFYPYLTIEALNFGVKEYVRDGVFVSDEVVMVMDGAASGTVYQGESGILGSTLCKLNINHEKISNELFYFILKAFESEVKKRNVGSTIPHANKNFINSIKISIPTDENILNLLNDHLQEIKNSIGVNRKTNSTLIQLRDYLLPLLMNGQVTVSDEVK